MNAFLIAVGNVLDLLRSYDMRRYATKEDLYLCRDELKKLIKENGDECSSDYDNLLKVILEHLPRPEK